MALEWFALVYVTVLASELGGDRSLVSVGALATRFRPALVFAGLLLAFAGKSAAAVLLGRSITGLPAGILTLLGTAALLAAALSIWRAPKPAVVGESDSGQAGAVPLASGAVAASFANVFFAEWGDPGQLATATLASQTAAPLTVWAGATLAMATKGALALGLGRVLRRYVSDRALRIGATAACLGMALLTVVHFVQVAHVRW